MQIVVLAGGISPERQVSLITGRAIQGSLERLGHQVTLIDPGLDLPQQLWQHKQQGCEFVWLALHGSKGEDGTVQAILDWLELPYQGSRPRASTLAMHKGLAKHLFRSAGIPTPPSLEGSLVDLQDWQTVTEKIGGSPLVLKPMDAGSSVGVSIVGDPQMWSQALAQVASLTDQAIAELFIPGQELTMSILDGKLLPTIEIVHNIGSFYSYESKYEAGGSQHLIPPKMDPVILTQAEQHALAAYHCLGCRGLARVDVRVDPQGQDWILEVNTLPGMTPTSLCPDAAAALGWSFDDLVDRILQASL